MNISNRIGATDPFERSEANQAGVATAAGTAIGRRVIAAMSQSVIDAKLQAAQDDLLLRPSDQRCVDPESAAALDPARVARLAIASKASRYSGRQSGYPE